MSFSICTIISSIGLSASTTLVIVFRAIQGIFGAIIMTNSLALIRTDLPIEKLATVIIIFPSVGVEEEI